MRTEAPIDLASLRRAVRQRAVGNLLLLLLDEAGRTAGRLTVEPCARDAVVLRYRDVRTLTRRNGIFQYASRDFAVVLVCLIVGPRLLVRRPAPVSGRQRWFRRLLDSGRWVLIGLLGPSDGRILHSGCSVIDDMPAFQRRLGYVPEEPQLYPHLTGAEYLEMVGQLRGLPEPQLAEKIRPRPCLLTTEKLDARRILEGLRC